MAPPKIKKYDEITQKTAINKLIESITYHNIHIGELFATYDVNGTKSMSLNEFTPLMKKIDPNMD